MVKPLNLGLALITQNVNTLRGKIKPQPKGPKCPKCGEGVLITRKGEKMVKNGGLKAVLTTQNVIIKNGGSGKKKVIFLY